MLFKQHVPVHTGNMDSECECYETYNFNFGDNRFDDVIWLLLVYPMTHPMSSLNKHMHNNTTIV